MQYETYLELGNPIPSWLIIIIITKNVCFCDFFSPMFQENIDHQLQTEPHPKRSQERPKYHLTVQGVTFQIEKGSIPTKRFKSPPSPNGEVSNSKKKWEAPPKNGFMIGFPQKNMPSTDGHPPSWPLRAFFPTERSHIAAHPLRRSGQAEARGFPVHVTQLLN